MLLFQLILNIKPNSRSRAHRDVPKINEVCSGHCSQQLSNGWQVKSEHTCVVRTSLQKIQILVQLKFQYANRLNCRLHQMLDSSCISLTKPVSSIKTQGWNWHSHSLSYLAHAKKSLNTAKHRPVPWRTDKIITQVEAQLCHNRLNKSFNSLIRSTRALVTKRRWPAQCPSLFASPKHSPPSHLIRPSLYLQEMHVLTKNELSLELDSLELDNSSWTNTRAFQNLPPANGLRRFCINSN